MESGKPKATNAEKRENHKRCFKVAIWNGTRFDYLGRVSIHKVWMDTKTGGKWFVGGYVILLNTANNMIHIKVDFWKNKH